MELQISPILGEALTAKNLSNEDVVSALEARYRKKIKSDIKAIEIESSSILSEKNQFEHGYEQVVNDIIDKWVGDNYNTLIQSISLTGLDAADLPLESLQHEAHFRFGRWWNSGERKTAVDDDRRILLVISLYPGKLSGEDSDDSVESAIQFIFSRVLKIPEENVTALEHMSESINDLEKKWSKARDDIHKLSQEFDKCEYRIKQFRGELIDDMMSKSEEGKAAQEFLDGVIDRIRVV